MSWQDKLSGEEFTSPKQSLDFVLTISHSHTCSRCQLAADELVLVCDDGGDDAAAEHPALRLPHHPQQEDLRRRPDEDPEHGLAQQEEGVCRARERFYSFIQHFLYQQLTIE